MDKTPLTSVGYNVGHNYRRLLAALLLWCAAQPAGAGEPVVDAVVDAVRRFLVQETRQLGDSVAIAVIAPRARFPACPRPQPYFPGNAQQHWGLVTVGVRCQDGENTQRYVQARVSISVQYWVTSQAVPTNTPLHPSLLQARTGQLGELPRQVIRRLDDLRGRVTSRPLSRGTIVQASLLRTPPLVERRQAVSVEARGSGFHITRPGQALDAGAQGDRIRVRMPNRDTLRAEVIAPGRVTVSW